MRGPPIGRGMSLLYFGTGGLGVVLQLLRGMTLGAVILLILVIVYALPFHRLVRPGALSVHDHFGLVSVFAGLALWVTKSNDPVYGFGSSLALWSMYGMIRMPRFWRPPFLDRLWRREPEACETEKSLA